jgi:translation initiation factor 1
MGNNKNTKLVWSDDPRDRARVEDRKDKKKSAPESTDAYVKSLSWTAVFRLEKNGRGGKTVTILDQLPRQDAFVKELCKEIKSKCGSGGTYEISDSAGVIEIQGDKREAIKALLDKKGIKYKGM